MDNYYFFGFVGMYGRTGTRFCRPQERLQMATGRPSACVTYQICVIGYYIDAPCIIKIAALRVPWIANSQLRVACIF